MLIAHSSWQLRAISYQPSTISHQLSAINYELLAMNKQGRFGYEDLEVWQKAIDWASEIVSLCNDLDTERRHYRLIEQLESACTSVAMNIAEGKGRYSQKEFVQYLYVARGSLYETVTLLEIFLKQGWMAEDKSAKLKDEAKEIVKMLNSLVKSIKNSQTTRHQP
jgi:four helix bundle protein